MVLTKQLTSDAEKNVAERPTLERISKDGCIGRRAMELYNMFYKHGPGNGAMLSLPFDQLVEHGIGHILSWENSGNPEAVIELAGSGKFSALAFSIGQAEKYKRLVKECGVPLIVKVDGHFLVGDEVVYPRHSEMASVKRAVDAGANAIGLTFYLGGEETQQDVERVSRIIEEAHKSEKPVFMWAYARGPLVDKMGADSLYWCSQGVSAGESLGADVVKQKFPMPLSNKKISEYKMNLERKGYLGSKMPDAEKLLELEPKNSEETPSELHVKRLSFMARCAPRTQVIVSGGPKSENEEGLLKTLRIIMDSGLEGQIMGRNLWARPIEEALALNARMISIMQDEKYSRKLSAEFVGKYARK